MFLQRYDFGIANASFEAKHQSSMLKAGPREMNKNKIPLNYKSSEFRLELPPTCK